MFDTLNDRDSLVFQIDSLKSSLELKDSTINSFRKQLREHEERINGVKQYVKDMYGSDNGVSVTRILEILDITLTKRYDVDITVTYSGTIELPLDADINDFDEHVNFEFSAPFSDEWEFDISQEDADIQYEESE